MVPLSLFATARRHWAWLRGAIERHCQFSGRPVYTGLKKMKVLHPIPGLLTQPTGKSHTQVDACVCGGEIPPPSPTGASNLQPVLHHAGVVSAQS